jgi:hypothetical protein
VAKMFERGLGASRLVKLVAVVAGIVLALGAFCVALVDVYHCFALLVRLRRPLPQPLGLLRPPQRLGDDHRQGPPAAPCTSHLASAGVGTTSPRLAGGLDPNVDHRRVGLAVRVLHPVLELVRAGEPFAGV